MQDIEPFLNRAFGDVKHLRSDYAVNCPFCATRYGSDDYKYKLQISKMKPAVHCWRCEYKASWTKLIMDVLNCTYVQALGELYITPKPILQSDLFSSTTANASNPRSKTFSIPDGYIPIHSKPMVHIDEVSALRAYLLQRGFDSRYWRTYNLCCVPNTWRVHIPIEGDLWQARAIFPYMKPKYLSTDVPAESALFNAPALDEYDEIVVCEGAFSAMAIGQNAIALVGKNPTIQKVARLSASKANKFIITFEQNAVSMLQLADALIARGKTVEIWKYEDGTDPADFTVPHMYNYSFGTKIRLLMGE